MKASHVLGCIILFAFSLTSLSGSDSKSGENTDSLGFNYDTFILDKTEFRLTFIGHASLMLTYGDKVIHVDPIGTYADYGKLPKADLILVTHSHFDHLDKEAIRKITKSATITAANPESAKQIDGALALSNGDQKTLAGFVVQAVPAYNTTSGREAYHPKGRDNGYVITIGGKRIYIAGDTENITEMKNLKDIFIAFLPMNQPYTMTPKQAADASREIRPAILYPYHFGDTKTDELVNLLAGDKSIEVRIRKLK
jgi:L-ascorbate metabolism protein UlaG (beta-lactamase superfamily)